jgi:hypothetical protein
MILPVVHYSPKIQTMIIFPCQNMKDLHFKKVAILEYYTFMVNTLSCNANSSRFSIFTYLGSHEFLLCALGTDDILTVCDET